MQAAAAARPSGAARPPPPPLGCLGPAAARHAVHGVGAPVIEDDERAATRAPPCAPPPRVRRHHQGAPCGMLPQAWPDEKVRDGGSPRWGHPSQQGTSPGRPIDPRLSNQARGSPRTHTCVPKTGQCRAPAPVPPAGSAFAEPLGQVGGKKHETHKVPILCWTSRVWGEASTQSSQGNPDEVRQEAARRAPTCVCTQPRVVAKAGSIGWTAHLKPMTL
ncbi:MAG: hypothetical protein J3K34DRAFT_147133 [Monoraphidium minutum]|nr:MAG: hypothetical protein J3K34DRAFT_147133 [Monoraphidium minutum]